MKRRKRNRKLEEDKGSSKRRVDMNNIIGIICLYYNY